MEAPEIPEATPETPEDAEYRARVKRRRRLIGAVLLFLFAGLPLIAEILFGALSAG
jgi:hypothetical protein